jgi:hypothetical protein
MPVIHSTPIMTKEPATMLIATRAASHLLVDASHLLVELM